MSLKLRFPGTNSDPAIDYENVGTSPAYSPAGGRLFRGLYIGGTGTVIVTGAGGNTVTFSGLAAGVIHDKLGGASIGTASTATGMIALVDNK